MNKILLVLAHGESWEIGASRAVADLVKKIIEEQIANQEQSEQGGAVNLHYIPPSSDRKAIVIPLSSGNKSLDHHPESDLKQGVNQGVYFEKVEHVEA
jgi:hypothetical protein